MALTKTTSFNTSFDVSVAIPNAYIKVASVLTSKGVSSANVDTFVSEGGALVESKSYEFQTNLSGGNAIAQAYEHLKTLPEFADATDC